MKVLDMIQLARLEMNLMFLLLIIVPSFLISLKNYDKNLLRFHNYYLIQNMMRRKYFFYM